MFLPILIEKKRFDVFFSEVESFRNTVAHGRILTLSQENLQSGIASDLKKLITVYHNKNEMRDDFFIRIINVTDNFGNNVTNNLARPFPILRVGDELELTIEANDPKDRQIEYEIKSVGSDFKMVQSSNRFVFTITKEFIRDMFALYVRVRTPDSDYPNDTSVMTCYTVLPDS